MSKHGTVVAMANDTGFDEKTFETLMSLALDDQLTPEAARRFEQMLEQAATVDVPEPAATWALWQAVDSRLTAAPRVTPPAQFSANVMQQIAWQERRKRLWLGSAIGLAALLLLGTGLVGVLGLVALFSSSQMAGLGEFGGEFGQTALLWWSVMAGFVDSALRSAGALLATAQARAIVLIYCTAAATMLGLWGVWLRRSTRLDGDAPSLGG
ncbi:MAG: hypothetical protein WDZ49_16525 [Litorilinea sp.]